VLGASSLLLDVRAHCILPISWTKDLFPNESITSHSSSDLLEYMMSLTHKSQAILSTFRKLAIMPSNILGLGQFLLRFPLGDNGLLHRHPIFWPSRACSNPGIQKITKGPHKNLIEQTSIMNALILVPETRMEHLRHSIHELAVEFPLRYHASRLGYRGNLLQLIREDNNLLEYLKSQIMDRLRLWQNTIQYHTGSEQESPIYGEPVPSHIRAQAEGPVAVRATWS